MSAKSETSVRDKLGGNLSEKLNDNLSDNLSHSLSDKINPGSGGPPLNSQTQATGRRALVAGGAGFIGSHMVDHLLGLGYYVTVIDNLITGRMSNLEAAHANGGDRYRFLNLNINELKPATFASHFGSEQFHEIYNLASPASPVDFKRIPIFILDTATHGHKNLLELGRAHGARVLFASSSEVYGDAEVHPQPESYHGNVNTLGMRGCYDEAKRVGESLSVAYEREYGVQVRIVRIFNTYGPRMRPNDGRIIPNFFIQALQNQALTIYGDGSQTRSFCYVADQVAGQYALMQSDQNRPVNIGNPIERTVLDVARAILDLCGRGKIGTGADAIPKAESEKLVRSLPLPENDPKLRRPDIRLANEKLNWHPKVDIEYGLRTCLENFTHELKLAPDGIEAPNVS